MVEIFWSMKGLEAGDVLLSLLNIIPIVNRTQKI